MEPYYHDAGQYYFMDAKKFMSDSIKNVAPYILTDLDVQDIDSLEDWEIAEIKYKLLLEKK